MDTFEYAVVRLYFKEPNEAEHVRGIWAFLDIVTYVSDGSKPGEADVQTIDLKARVYTKRHQARFEDGDRPGENTKVLDWDEISVTGNFAISKMAPYLALLGAQGWEVVEYKTASEPAIGQALLKRRTKK